MAEPAIDVRHLVKTFGSQRALCGVSLSVDSGQMVALIGASGSGKSTLLRHICGLQRSDRRADARISLFGREVQSGGVLGPHVRAIRADAAMIFQQFNLVDRLPVMTNVLAGAMHRMPWWRWMLGRFSRTEQQRAYAALCRVGIERCAWQRASTLSGGQQQRAAISRAIVQGARVILADEPIASLDPESSRRVMELLAEVNRDLGVTVLVSLHQVDYAFAFCPRTVALRAGEVVYDGPTKLLTVERLRSLYGTQTDELFAPPEGLTAGLPRVPVLKVA